MKKPVKPLWESFEYKHRTILARDATFCETVGDLIERLKEEYLPTDFIKTEHSHSSSETVIYRVNNAAAQKEYQEALLEYEEKLKEYSGFLIKKKKAQLKRLQEELGDEG